ncbi:MAG: hypothetical protein IKC09_05600, partial [Oscillospiraceae bacterium]|nr:hypothetical protein [Oscillospiraceae bacterium]
GFSVQIIAPLFEARGNFPAKWYDVVSTWSSLKMFYVNWSGGHLTSVQEIATSPPFGRLLAMTTVPNRL